MICGAESARTGARCELPSGHSGPHERVKPGAKLPVRWGGREEWSHVRQEQRKRKGVYLTLSDAAREALAELASKHPDGTKSAVVEDLILEAQKREE